MSRMLKKVITIVLAAALLFPLGLLAPVAEASAPEIPVLLYHRVVSNPTNEWTDTSVEKFRNTMQYLNDNGYDTLSAEQYVNILEEKETAPDKPILLTFDDATPDFVTNALPILKQYGMKSVLFVVSDWINGGYSMTTAQLQGVAAEPSVSLQNHSKTHNGSNDSAPGEVWTANITKEQAATEISAANTYLKGITNKDPVLLAYPYGAFNTDAEAAAGENGIKYSFKVGYPNNGNHAMGRHYVQMGTTLAQIAGWIGGPAPAPETPTTPTTPAGATVLSLGFEDDNVGGWAPLSWGGSGTVAITDEQASAGTRSLKFSGRATKDASPAINIFSLLQQGRTYDISLKIRLGSGTDKVHVTSKVGSTFSWIMGEQDVSNTAWVSFNNTGYTLPAGATELLLYVETAASTADIYIDEVLIKDTTPNVTTNVLNQGFEDGNVGGWAPLSWGGSGSVAVTNEQASAGTRSLKFSGRAAKAASPAINIFSLLQQGRTYDLSMKIRLGSGTDKVHVTSKVGETFDWIMGEMDVSNTAWVSFSKTGYTLPAGAAELLLYVETAASTADIYIDEFVITDVTPGQQEPEPTRDPALPFNTITFEDQTANGFVGRAGTETLTVTNEANHTTNGSYALKVEGRTTSWHGPSLRVEKYVDKGYEYKVSMWVKLISPASSQLQLSTQVGDGSSASYNNILGKTITTADGWVLYEGNYRYTSVGGEYLTIYIESSSNATASFYIDDISFVRGAAPVSVQKDLTPIKTHYQNDFLIGNAVSAADLDGTRLELLKLHHNVVTAENAMKPDATQAVKGTFTYADSLVDKAVAEGMKVHGHVLVWHQQTPAWMNTANNAPLSREEALTNLRTHIRTVMEHYGNKIISWDVVNEAIIDNPPTPSDYKASLRRSAWFNSIGDDFVKQSFLAAREVLDDHPEWNIKLYYNDYNEDNQGKAQAIYSMVKAINDEYALEHPGKLLIDGVGMQAHYNLNTNPENVKLSLEKFISLGVEVSVTELDIQAGSNSTQTDQQKAAQGYLYAQLFKLYKEHADKIARVTFWGLNDTTSWRSETSPLVFDRNLQAKPAYYGVINPAKFMADHAPDTKEALQSTAKYGTPTVDGNVDAVWSQATALPVNRYQMAWQGASGVAKALWDDQNLYVLVQVSDTQLNKAHADAWEQDSVEVFLDQNNGKTSFYQADDGQYRVNFDNETSFSSAAIAEGFASATKINGTSYTVEMKLPLNKITAANDKLIGFDVQINDAKDGARQSVAAWNDTSGTGYMDTSVYGVLTLSGKTTSPGTSGPGTGTVVVTNPPTGTIDNKDGVVTIKPEVKAENGRAIGTISNDNLKKALDQATPTAYGLKLVVIEVPKQANAESYEVQLPTASLKGQETFALVMKTDNATLQIPSNMLSNVTANAEQVSIRVDKASTDSLDAATRERIGNRPVIDLNVVVDGSVVAWNNPNAPVAVVIPYTPSADELNNPDHIVIWYIDGEGKATPIPNGRYDEESGAVVFQTTHFSTYAVASVSKTFGDLENVAWAKQAIDAMAARDVIKGTDENSFSPEASIKRADFIALLVRALELQGSGKAEDMFSDVRESDYYYTELAIAKELGIANGYEDNTFKPESNISRQDMMVLTARALAAAGLEVEAGDTLDAYPDAADVSDYAVDSAAALVEVGIINGKDDKLAPQDLLTRAEAAVILYRVWGL